MKNITIKFANIIFISITLLLLLSGLCARIFIWLHSGCFWADEGCLLYNIENRSYLQLFMPLSYMQCSPPVFLTIGKIFYSAFGTNHIALKFIPFCASVLSIFLFAWFASKILKNKISVMLAIFIFTFHQELLLYTQAFKQYSFDVLFTILIFSAVIWIKNHKITDKQWLILGFLSLVCFLSSYTSIILIGIIAFVYVFCLIKNKKFDDLKSFTFFIMPAVTGFIIYFIYNCLPAIQNEGLQNYWHYQESFFPKSVSDLNLLINFLTGGGGYNCSSVFVSLLFLCGLGLFFLTDKFFFYILVFPFIISAVLAAFNIYPLAPSRVSIYLAPLFIILISKPCDLLVKNNIFINILLFLCIFLAIPFKDTLLNIKNLLNEKVVYKQSNACHFVKKLYQSDITKDDYVYLDLASQVIFEIYDTAKKIHPEQIIYSVQYGGKIETTLDMLPTGKNIFFFISDDYIWDNQFEVYSRWINSHCRIIYSQKDDNGDFIKCKKIK